MKHPIFKMTGGISQFIFLWVGDGYIIPPSYIPNKKIKKKLEKSKKNNVKNKEK